jgi:CarD family transcriptional regulator
MFEVGDKILYPMYGATVVESIQEKEILGETHLYYMFTLDNMQVMVPTEKSAEIGIREVVDSDTIEDVLSIFHDEETDSTISPTHRHRINAARMKSGNIYEGAQVIRDLVRIAKNKVLGTDDKKMLNNARKILLSELILVKGIDHDQAEELLDRVIYD